MRAHHTALSASGHDTVISYSGFSVTLIVAQPKGCFYHLELDGLEARCRAQQIAEIEEVERRHGFQNAHLHNGYLENSTYTLEAMHAIVDVCGIVFNIGLHENFTHDVEFVQDLLEPELVCLMDDDKQHFIVGTDAFGNRYFRDRRGDRRWVIYNGEAEASRIPPGWHGWMHHRTDVPPTEDGYKPHEWEKPHLPNLTGTPAAYRPRGSILRAERSGEVTDEYEPWTPA